MAEIITGITYQPNFPREDLTEDNADLLELMMANVQLVQSSHQAVEQISLLFRLGHPAIVFSAAKIHDDDSRLAAVNHGVASFEAITAMVGGDIAADLEATNRETGKLLHLDPSHVSDYFDEAMERFRQETPHAAEVVRCSTTRFHGPLTTYALLGAAMSRKFELDVA